MLSGFLKMSEFTRTCTHIYASTHIPPPDIVIASVTCTYQQTFIREIIEMQAAFTHWSRRTVCIKPRMFWSCFFGSIHNPLAWLEVWPPFFSLYLLPRKTWHLSLDDCGRQHAILCHLFLFPISSAPAAWAEVLHFGLV